MFDTSLWYIPKHHDPENLHAHVHGFTLHDDSTKCCLLDFDYTLTRCDSLTTWSFFTQANCLPADIVARRLALYRHYRPLELDSSISESDRAQHMYDWAKQSLDLLVEAGLTRQMITDIIREFEPIQFRAGAKEFLCACRDAHIPVIIISAGIGDVIEIFLEHHGLLHDHISIDSNFLQWDDTGRSIGSSDNLIYTGNKRSIRLSEKTRTLVSGRTHSFMIGDHPNDLQMAEIFPHMHSLHIALLTEGMSFEHFEGLDWHMVSRSDSFDPIMQLSRQMFHSFSL